MANPKWVRGEERCPLCRRLEEWLIEVVIEDDGEREYIRGRRCRRCGWVHIHRD